MGREVEACGRVVGDGLGGEVLRDLTKRKPLIPEGRRLARSDSKRPKSRSLATICLRLEYQLPVGFSMIYVCKLFTTTFSWTECNPDVPVCIL